MVFSKLTKKILRSSSQTGVYTDLDSLTRLQVKAMGFSLLPRQPIHSQLAGRHASHLRGRGMNFEEIRGYLPGDDIRNMDWKVTARMRKPHVRVYTEERDRPVLLVVDQRLSMFFGSQRAMKSVAAAETAALAAWRVLSVRDRVGAVIFNDTDIVEIKPHSSRNRVMEILGALSRMNQQLSITASTRSDATMFNRVLQRVCRLASHDHLVCLIGDGTGNDESTARQITQLNEHNDILSVFIYDPMESQLPNAGRLVMAENENQMEVNTSDRQIQDQYRNDFESRLESFQQAARKRKMPLLQISTAEEVAKQIRRQLGHIPGK